MMPQSYCHAIWTKRKAALEREANTQRARQEAYEAIPFWGEIYRDNNG